MLQSLTLHDNFHISLATLSAGETEVALRRDTVAVRLRGTAAFNIREATGDFTNLFPVAINTDIELPTIGRSALYVSAAGAGSLAVMEFTSLHASRD